MTEPKKLSQNSRATVVPLSWLPRAARGPAAVELNGQMPKPSPA